jgi:hypothetical protein
LGIYAITENWRGKRNGETGSGAKCKGRKDREVATSAILLFDYDGSDYSRHQENFSLS